MSEEVINKWKDVSPEDITSEPNWEEGWELVHAEVVKVHDASEILKEYIGKRFRPNPKANFVAFIKGKTEIKISKKQKCVPVWLMHFIKPWLRQHGCTNSRHSMKD